MQRIRILAASTLVACLLTGCSTENPGASEKEPRASDSASPRQPESEAPTLAGVRTMIKQPVDFSYELLGVDGTRYYSLEGIADVANRSWTGSVEIDDPSTGAPVDVRAEIRSIEDKLWFRFGEGTGELAGCWGDVSAGFETLGTLEPVMGVPNAVLVLATLKTANARAPLPKLPVGASLSVRSAVGNALPPRVAMRLDLDNLPRGTVAARVQVKRPSDVTISVRGVDVSDSLHGLGSTVPKEVDRFLLATEVVMGLRPAKKAPEILPPPKDSVMTPDDVDAGGAPVPCRKGTPPGTVAS